MQHERLTRAEMEERRIQAAALYREAWKPADVARRLGVSRAAASRWKNAFAGGGMEALKGTRAPGRPSRLTDAQLEEIAALYQHNPRYWTRNRLSEVIFDSFGVRLNRDHIIRKLHKLGVVWKRRRRAAVIIELPVAEGRL